MSSGRAMMENKPEYNESTITGSMMNRADQYSGKIFIQSWFDENGRKTGQIHSVTWAESRKMIVNSARALITLGLKPGDRAAVCGPNTPMWCTAVFSIILCRATYVPIYPTSKSEDVWWCLHDSASKIAFCHGREQLDRVLENRNRLNDLKWIIVFDPDVKCTESGVMSFNDFIKRGESSAVDDSEIEKLIRESDENDLASIIYTSGTTGRPKGVMLTNKNFISQRSIAGEFHFTPDDIWLAHLPMCHSLGFTSDLLNSGHQAGTLFISDSIETEEMRKNLRACRPTVMTSVPRLWEKLYLQINMKVAERPKFVRNIVSWAVKTGREKFLLTMDKKPVSLPLRLKSKLAGRIFRRIRNEAGLDRLRICITGGGPIHPDLLIFFGSIGIYIYQGYGLTETSPVTHVCTPANNKIGSIGKAIPDTVCRIAEDGEILIKGPQVMRGYLNNPAATKETFTEDGFFKTGDIGIMDENGFVRITDRKKELIITSGGKNIAPQPIQEEFNTDPFVEQIFVTGDGRNFIGALIVPNFPFLEEWARQKGIDFRSRQDLINNDKTKKLFDERVAKINKNLSKYESIKKYVLLLEEFSEKGGELTPTLKMKRKFIEQKYRDIIDSIYAGS